MSKRLLALSNVLLAAISAFAGHFTFDIAVDRDPAVYKAGETARITIHLLEDGAPAIGRLLKYRVEYGPEQTTVIGESPLVLEPSLDHPGQIFIKGSAYEPDGINRVANIDGNGNRHACHFGIGVMFDPGQLRASHPKPADFDAYWDGEIARQKKEVPLDVEKISRTLVPDREDFDLYDVYIPALSRTPTAGYLSLPKDAKPKSLPVIVRVIGAGTTSAYRMFFDNAITFSINAHGCRNGETKEYYDAFFSTIAENYPLQGREYRATYYFHGQIMRLVRALEYVKTLPEWNGRDLIIEGTSMGGSQALLGAALDPDVTLCVANDPAQCDHFAELDTPARHPGWPRLINDGDERVRAAAAYYDNIYFSERIRCEVCIASGFADDTCFSSGVYIAFNRMPSKNKTITTSPTAGHCGTRNVTGFRRIEEIVRAAHERAPAQDYELGHNSYRHGFPNPRSVK
jgi:cephalosporin-C deacetylase